MERFYSEAHWRMLQVIPNMIEARRDQSY